jgi:aminomethyltransferase
MGAKMVGFAGWEMPLQYQSVVEEHVAVRARAGIFDVSHMGEIEVRGPGALGTLQNLTCNDVARLTPGKAQYSAFTTERGTFIDDIIVYRRAEDLFLVVVNAANEEKDFAWVTSHLLPGAEAINRSAEYAQIAVQGPDAMGILRGQAEADLDLLRPFGFVEAPVAGTPCLTARVGYTGEDGFELYCPPDTAWELWETISAVGAPFGLTPCGLAARDTLRLEACLLLYGNEIDDTTTVLESGLNFILKLDKGEFIGREALRTQKERGVSRRLSAFEMLGRGIARHGYPVQVDGRDAGHVTSGTHGPFVKKNIGLAYLPTAAAQEGREFDVIIRGKATRARVVKPPFYRRKAADR